MYEIYVTGRQTIWLLRISSKKRTTPSLKIKENLSPFTLEKGIRITDKNFVSSDRCNRVRWTVSWELIHFQRILTLILWNERSRGSVPGSSWMSEVEKTFGVRLGPDNDDGEFVSDRNWVERTGHYTDNSTGPVQVLRHLSPLTVPSENQLFLVFLHKNVSSSGDPSRSSLHVLL